MSKFTYEMVKRFIDLGMKTITLKWNEVDPAWKILIHERIISAGYELISYDNNTRIYGIKNK